MNQHPDDDRLGELYMILRDREKLASVMIVQSISQRELAAAAGWRSHTYMQRLLRGEVNSLRPDAALRIAHRLGVPVDMLFMTKMSSIAESTVRDKKRRSRR